MIDIPVEQLTTWVSGFLWPLFRITAFFMFMPIISSQLVPARVRMGLAVVTTLIIAPLLPEMPTFDGLSLTTFLLIAQQLLIGFSMAFIFQMFFHIFVLAGQLIAMQMGLGFASLSDPVNGVAVVVLGQFYLMLTMLMFVCMNGHLVVIEVFIESFKTMPVAIESFDRGMFMQLVTWALWMFASALMIALPAVCALLVVNFAFGIMNRAAPQLNVFALGFPISMLVGLVIVFVTLPRFVPQFDQLAGQSLMMMRSLLTL
jgi:flagellar biosynthetic protein FliR